MTKQLTKYILTLVALLCITINAWGKEWKWTVNVGVAAGKGTAKAEIIKHSLGESSEKSCSSSTLSLASTYVTTDNWLATSNSNRSYKYTATPETGYSFKGWYSGTDVSGMASSTANPMTGGKTNQGFDYTFYAKFVPNVYTVNFNANGGTIATSSKPVTYDAAYGTLPTPIRDGFTFTGWYTAASGGNQVTESTIMTTASNHTLYAHWTENSYTISFDGNGSTSGTIANMAMVYNTAKNLTANAFSRQYTVTYDAVGGTSSANSASATYSFVGWEDPNSIVFNGTTYSSDEFDAPYYANTYSDLYNAFGYNKYNLLQHYINHGKGEKRDPKGAIPGVYPNNASVSNLSTTAGATVTLYAQWQSASVVLPNATKSGAVIEGWYAGSVKVGEPGDSYTPTENVTLTAKWIEKYTPEITGDNYALFVGGEQANAFSFKYTDNPTAHIEVVSISTVNDGSGNVISYDAINNKIIAHNAGEATIYLSQAETETIKAGNSAKYRVIVSKINNTLAIASNSYTKYVDDVIENIISTSSVNSDATITTTSSDATIACYDVANNKIQIPNSEAKSFSSQTVTITIAQAETYKYKAAEKTVTLTVKKHTPVFIFNPAVTSSPEKLYFNSEYPDYFTTTANSPLTIKSSDELVAKWEQGSNAQSYTLKTFSKTNTATLTAIQQENYYWERLEGSIEIQLQKPTNHVTFTYTQEMFNDENITIEKIASESCTWGDNGIKLESEATNWDDKYVVIRFEGIPKDISFKYKASSENVSNGWTEYRQADWYIAEGAEGANGEIQWSDTYLWENMGGDQSNSTSWVQVSNKSLQPTTRYIKLCYSGNYAGYYSDVTVTELDQFAAIDAEENMVTAIDFGDEVHVDTKQTREFNFQYANVGYKVKFEVVSDSPENAAIAKQYITFSHEDLVTIDGEKYLTSIGGEQSGTINNIAVQFYSASDEYSIPANTQIKISDEIGHVRYISLSGEIKRADQVLTWQGLFLKDPVILPLTTGTFTGVAISSNSDLPITYTSSKPDIIAVSADGKSLTPLKEGEVYITANQVGNDKYKPAESITKPVIVTGKKVQVIIWESNLTDLQVGDEPVTLTAKAYWIDMENDAQLVYSEEQTSKIQFTSNDPSIVSIEGNVLTIHAAGPTTVKAFVPGNETYKEDQQVIPVRVRPATEWCDDVLLLNNPDEYEFFIFDLNRPELISSTYEIDHSKGVPGTLEFQYTGKPWTLVIEYCEGTIHAQQSIDGSTWTTVATVTPTKNATNISEGSLLDRQAKYIRFVRAKGGVGYHYVSNIKVHPAQYIEPSQEVIDFSTVQYGSQNTFTFDVAYSNIKYQLSPKTSASDVQVSPQSFGACGAFGTQTITGTWTPNEGGDNITRTITFTDVNTGMSATVTLKANVLKKDQFIKWEDAPAEIDDYSDIDSRPLKTVNASDEEVRDITYEIVEGADLAAFDNGMFYIKGTGDIRIRAYHNGDAEYKPVELVKDIKITSMSPTFVGTTSQSWATSENWVNGIKPTDTDDFAVILAPVTIAEDVSASGLQIASAGAIHIAAKGGLTVGERGVVNSTDDTKISIDNNLDGAGFLRINPQANDIPNQVTVNYTTRTYDNGSPRNEVWQYLGMPGANGQISSLEGVSMYHWKETSGWIQKSAADLQNIPAWDGYAFTQSKEKDATFQINVEPILDNKQIDFTCTPKGMKGDNLFVNSYLAPIDVTKIDENDIVDPNNILVRTFFIFNSGSWNDWIAGAGDITAASGYDQSSPGHYYSIPFYSAKLIDDGTTQVVIPSMQGVYVYSAGASSIKLDYNKHVLGANAQNMHNPMRAPQYQMEDESFRRVRIQASSENSGADRMYIVQEKNTTPGYDNGYDGDNINASEQVNIYVHEPFGQLEVACSNHIDSTCIGFTAGVDTTYTLTFGAVVGEDMYLVDNLTDSLMHLSDGKQYIFYAQPNSVDDMRFRLVVIPNPEDDDSTNNDGETSDVDNISSSVNLWIHDNIVYVLDAPHNSSLSIYSVSGMCIQAPHTIHHSPCTIDLSHLPTGVYVLRLNDKAFKIVCD